MGKLFQIHEEDLCELERLMPLLMQEHAEVLRPRDKTQWRRVQKIIGDVRWCYGPWQECEKVPPDDPEPSQPEGAARDN